MDADGDDLLSAEELKTGLAKHGISINTRQGIHPDTPH